MKGDKQVSNMLSWRCLRYLGGAIRLTVVYMGLKFRRMIQARDRKQVKIVGI